jgi:hypothetical protein
VSCTTITRPPLSCLVQNTSVVVMLRVSPSNTNEVTTCGPRWQPTSAPERSTATTVDTERAVRHCAWAGSSALHSIILEPQCYSFRLVHAGSRWTTSDLSHIR